MFNVRSLDFLDSKLNLIFQFNCVFFSFWVETSRRAESLKTESVLNLFVGGKGQYRLFSFFFFLSFYCRYFFIILLVVVNDDESFNVQGDIASLSPSLPTTTTTIISPTFFKNRLWEPRPKIVYDRPLLAETRFVFRQRRYSSN